MVREKCENFVVTMLYVTLQAGVSDSCCHVTHSICWHSDQDGYSSSTTWEAKTSPVWDYFKYDVTLGKTVCQVDVNGKYCEATLKGKFSTNLKEKY